MQNTLQERFYSYLQFEKRRSSHTLRSYQSDISSFCAYINKVYDINDLSRVSSAMVRSWIVDLVESDQSVATIRRKLASLRSLYKYGIKVAEVSMNPVETIQAPKQGKRLPVYYQVNEMDQLFNEIPFEDSFEGIRDRLVLEILYSTGMRNDELVKLKDSDVDDKQKFVKVTGKRNKQRIIPVSERLLKNVKVYKEIRNKTFSGINNMETLVVSNNGNNAYPKLIYRIVHKYLSEVTTMNKRSPHKLRHTFATHMLNAGADLNTIKELLGHSSLDATQVYTHNSIDQLKSIYKQAHPGA